MLPPACPVDVYRDKLRTSLNSFFGHIVYRRNSAVYMRACIRVYVCVALRGGSRAWASVTHKINIAPTRDRDPQIERVNFLRNLSSDNLGPFQVQMLARRLSWYVNILFPFSLSLSLGDATRVVILISLFVLHFRRESSSRRRGAKRDEARRERSYI